MTVDLWLARTFSVIAALLSLGIAFGAGAVFRLYYQRFRAGSDSSFNTQGLVVATVAVGLEAILFAVLDVGQAFALVSEGWGAIVGIIGTLIMPILGYKSVQAVQASKGGPTNVTGG